jgi:hypothetical protein
MEAVVQKFFVVDQGFIFIGEEAKHPTDGWTLIKNAAIVRSYTGGEGIGGVCKGTDNSTVYDPIPEDVEIPTSRVVFTTLMEHNATFKKTK